MKLIQVGIGGMGSTWLSAILNFRKMAFAGFVEVNDGVAKAQAERFGIDPALIFPSLKDALTKLSADAVIDITPPQFHRAVALTALEAGIPVLSEKPLANTLEAAQDIVRKAEETDVLHMVAQNYRYSVPAQTLKRVLDSGQMGRVASVSVEFFKGPHFGGFREEMPYPLIIDMAIHHFDMMRMFLHSDPISIYGRSWNPPWSWYNGDASAAISLEFANGVFVSYNASWCSTGVETPWNANWRVECENGVVLLHADRVYTQVRMDALQDHRGYRQVVNQKMSLVRPVEMEHTAQTYLLNEFYEAVTHGRIPATTCQDNIKSLSIAFDAVQSFETGTVVRRAVGPVVRPHNAARCAPRPTLRYPVVASSPVQPDGG